jgi:hypothetical protein
MSEDDKKNMKEFVEEQKKKLADKILSLRNKAKTEELTDKEIKQFEIAQFEKDSKYGSTCTMDMATSDFLFSHYLAGASLRSIAKRYGKEMGFSISTLMKIKERYLWDERVKAIKNLVMNNHAVEVAQNLDKYRVFLEDMIEEAIMRFNENMEGGKNSSPFETLKISNPKELTQILNAYINIANGGVKKLEVNHKGDINLKSEKVSKILEILAESENVTDAEVIPQEEPIEAQDETPVEEDEERDED